MSREKGNIKEILITRRFVPLDRLDGINIFIALTAEFLIEMGYSVTVGGIGKINSEFYKKNFGVKETPQFITCSNFFSNSLFQEIAYMLGLRKTVREGNWDLIIHNGVSFIRGRNKDLLLCHDWEPNHWNRFLQIMVQKSIYSRKKSMIAATSTEISMKLQKLVNREVPIINTCVRYKPIKKMAYEERFRITHIGTQKYKNPIGTLRIFEKIKDSNLTLSFIGTRNLELEKEICKLDIELQKRIELHSRLPHEEYMAILGESRYCSIPSGYSIGVLSPTCLDAFANGTPVIGSGLSMDLFTCKENGVCIEDALEINFISEIEWKKLSENAYATAGKFSVQNTFYNSFAIINKNE